MNLHEEPFLGLRHAQGQRADRVIPAMFDRLRILLSLPDKKKIKKA